jgi:glucans biosynthesis protein C
MSATISSPAAAAAQPAAAHAPATAAGASRIAFINRYKGLLAVLVVLIHTGITYGAAGGWYFHEAHDVFWLKAGATLIGSLSQSFVLGAFFFLSAYFLPRSLEKKGAGRFLLDRLVRLGIPYAVFYFLVNPLMVMAISGWGEGHPIPFGPHFGSGPLWFVEALFLFTLVFMGFDALRRVLGVKVRLRGFPSARAVWLYIGAAAVLGFAVRIVFPVGWSVHNLQLGFFPMYVILFAAGISAGRAGWLEKGAAGAAAGARVPAEDGDARHGRDARPAGAWEAALPVKVWLPIAIAGAVILLPALLLGGAAGGVDAFQGGLHWQSALYAAWEAVTGTALFISTFGLFARGRWKPSSAGESFASTSFGIYVLHAPVIILAAIAMSPLAVHPVIKYAVLSAGGICACWGLTLVLRKIPGVSRIL